MTNWVSSFPFVIPARPGYALPAWHIKNQTE